MNAQPSNFGFFALALVLLWLGLEGIARAVQSRRGGERPPSVWMTLFLWGLRPWGIWGLFSLAWRRQAEWAYEHNLRTFPFFANLWQPEAGLVGRLVTLAQWPPFWLWLGLALASLAGLVTLASRLVSRGDALSRGGVAGRLALIYLLGAGLLLSANSLPEGLRGRRPGKPGSLTMAWKAHQTVLYALPMIRDTRAYLRDFEAIQPRLRITIHALSHPPGAALSLYWLGRLAGVPPGADIRSETVRMRYVLALGGFGLLNVGLLYALGLALFGERRVGLLAAMAWVTAPTTLAYGTFAQDTVYLVFFTLCLWLTWRVATAQGPPRRLDLLLLGGAFATLVMLNFSWCIMTTVFAVFCLACGWVRRQSLARIAQGLVPPLALMTLFALPVLLYFRLDYWAIYRVAGDYVGQWYRFETPYQWIMALVGGQMDLWLMMGPISLAAFLWYERQSAVSGRDRLARLLLLSILTVFALPLLLGPNPLKMETARCWNWMLPVPLAFAARGLLAHPAAKWLAPAAVAASGLVFIAMRLFLDFAP